MHPPEALEDSVSPVKENGDIVRVRSWSKPWLIGGILFACLAFALQIRFFVAHPEWGSIDGVEVYSIAETLDKIGVFGNPWQILRATGPTACTAPGYPFILSVARRALGRDAATLLMFSLTIAAVSWASVLLLLPILSRRLFRTIWPGTLGSVLGLLPLHPMAIYSEGILSALLISSACLLSTYQAHPMFLGLAAGAVAYVHPLAIAVLMPFWWFVQRPRIRDVAFFTLASCGVISPWMIRNRIVFGEWFYMRDNFGLELYASNRDGAPLTQIEHIRLQRTAPHPNQSPAEAHALKEMGEMVYMQSRKATALHWISSHPISFATSVLMRGLAWIAPWRRDLVPYPAITIPVSLAGLVGIVLMPMRQRCAFLSALTAFSVPYLLVQSAQRYRTPVLWMFLIGAGYALLELARRIRRGDPSSVSHQTLSLSSSSAGASVQR